MTASPSIDREALRRTTAPRLLCRRARTTPDAVAFRAAHLGRYRERRWHDYATLVARAARAFAALGLARGERVAIMGDACEEWVVCDQAAQALGAVVYGIYPTAAASEVEYQMRDGGAVLFVAENQEYVDKILAFADRLPALRWIVVIDDSAMFAYAHPKLRSYESLLAEAGERRPRLARARGGQALAPERPRLHRLHVRHHRSSQGRAGLPWPSSRRHRQHRRSLSDAGREASTAPSPICRSATCSAATWR